MPRVNNKELTEKQIAKSIMYSRLESVFSWKNKQRDLVEQLVKTEVEKIDIEIICLFNNICSTFNIL